MSCLLSTQRFGYRVNNTPAPAYSLGYGSWVHIVFSSPLGGGKRESIKGNSQVASGIGSLLKLCCPNAIFRFVISVVVESFNRVICAGHRPHVGIKILKRFNPSFANRYSSSAVVSKVSTVNIAASFYDPLVNSVLFAVRHAVGFPYLILSKEFFMKTAARLRPASPKRQTCRNCCSTTVTQAIPHRPRLTAGCNFVISPAYDQKASKFLTGKVYKLWHLVVTPVMILLHCTIKQFTGLDGTTVRIDGTYSAGTRTIDALDGD